MTKPSTAAGTITHDTAARLIGVTPAELTALVNGGQVRRADKNAYSLPVLVQDYIGHLNSLIGLDRVAKDQAELAAIMDISDRSVREFIASSGMDHKKNTISEILTASLRHLREMAAGRAAAGDLDLATERAMLAREQRLRIEMQNAVTRGELAPAAWIEQVLSKAASRVGRKLDAIPGMVRRRVPELSADAIDLIAAAIATARNDVAVLSVADLDDDADDVAAEPFPSAPDETGEVIE